MSIPTSSVPLSGIHHIDSLIVGRKWNGSVGSSVTLTYSFGNIDSRYKTDYATKEPYTGFESFSENEQQATIQALKAWAEVANIELLQVSDSETTSGDIRFAKSSALGDAGWSYLPADFEESGDVWISSEDSPFLEDWSLGTFGFQNVLHEIGHSLGLKHPHDAPDTYPGYRSGPVSDLSIDSLAYSVMSYRSYIEQPLSSSDQSFYPTTLMINDIAAIQYLYGVNTNTRSGDDTYKWDRGQQILETIWDANGIDTIDWSNQLQDAQINLNPGEWSQLGPGYGVKSDGNGGWEIWETRTLNIAFGVTIENVIGGEGNDRVVGNEAENNLIGKKGNDTIYGGDGNDTIAGGIGQDELFGDSGDDRILAGDDSDTIVGGVGQDELFGGPADDRLVGGEGNDYMIGGSENDYLMGGSENDQLFGGNGSDTLMGNQDNDTLIGGKDDDYLDGGDGEDLLVGGHGLDTLVGNSGSDIFVIQDILSVSQDTITDFADGVDKLSFSDGLLTFDNLIIVNSSETNTSLINSSNGETLAVIQGIDASLIDISDFVDVDY